VFKEVVLFLEQHFVGGDLKSKQFSLPVLFLFCWFLYKLPNTAKVL